MRKLSDIWMIRDKKSEIKKADRERQIEAHKILPKREVSVPEPSLTERYIAAWGNRHVFLLSKGWAQLAEPKGYVIRYRHKVTRAKLLMTTRDEGYRYSLLFRDGIEVKLGPWTDVVIYIKREKDTCNNTKKSAPVKKYKVLPFRRA